MDYLIIKDIFFTHYNMKKYDSLWNKIKRSSKNIYDKNDNCNNYNSNSKNKNKNK